MIILGYGFKHIDNSISMRVYETLICVPSWSFWEQYLKTTTRWLKSKNTRNIFTLVGIYFKLATDVLEANPILDSDNCYWHEASLFDYPTLKSIYNKIKYT